VEAERRQVTVLFTDMVGFTSFSERSGEEAAFALMRSLSKLMDEAVRQQGGVVQSFTGDGIMAVFGAPVALEDAPLRACRAALNILQRLKLMGPDLEAKHGVCPQLRIGLNTGTAVVGKVGDSADAGVTVLGDTVNFAARLQSLAEPNSVLISDATYRLVQGLVDATFTGEHAVKGKSDRQKVHRLDAVRQGTTRFETAVSRGLGTFVGREKEMEALERGLDKSRSELCVIDLAAEPGMGKSRLLYEFRRRIGKDRAFVLAGNCSPDGQQTPFLPFIEVVRGSFRIRRGDSEKEIAQKLESGLSDLGLQSIRNLGLLLHLLGLSVPGGALSGLDSVLIGLRLRELLQQLLEARCKLSPVIMIIEDLHWIDSASEELLAKITDSKTKLRLLLVTTRRPEYTPLWRDRPAVTSLSLERLAVGDMRRLVQARLNVDALPEGLARHLTEKAEGNPLFAEEIVSYLTERGILRTDSGKLDFNDSTVTGTLPASVQTLLAARVDRLSPNDRALLQAASVIGRRFDPLLLAVAVNDTDVDDRLAAMQSVDLLHRVGKSDDYSFKHVLVRDALYQSLLTDARSALHAKIGNEIERRGGNRLPEVAEILAHHFSQTNMVDRAFAYLLMAGSKALDVYSLDEATTHLTSALALLDKHPTCASDNEFAKLFVAYSLLLNFSGRWKILIDTLERHLPRVDRLGDDPSVPLIRTHYVIALVINARYRDAAAAQRKTLEMAYRLGDSKSKAYALTSEIWLSTFVDPKPLESFEALNREAIDTASETADAFIQNGARWVVVFAKLLRGRINEAQAIAREFMRVGQQLNDPRSTGYGLAILAWIATFTESYAEALEYCERCLTVAVTPQDKAAAIGAKGSALVALGKTEDGAKLLEEWRVQSIADGNNLYLAATDPTVGVCKVLQGNLAQGIHIIEQAILKRENEGYRMAADWGRLILCEIYLQIIAGNEKPPLLVLLRNLPIILKVLVTASSRIRTLVAHAIKNPQFDPDGHFVGWANMILGLLYKNKKKHSLAIQHLTEARRIISEFGPSPMLARIETALAEIRNV
jgi:class 3 adenylate cyclase/tetratricopeptide (TPR) repeat protein